MMGYAPKRARVKSVGYERAGAMGRLTSLSQSGVGTKHVQPLLSHPRFAHTLVLAVLKSTETFFLFVFFFGGVHFLHTTKLMFTRSVVCEKGFVSVFFWGDEGEIQHTKGK